MDYNPYRKYCSSWWLYWRYFPMDVLRFVTRVWDYLPLLWEDRDWDYVYLLRLLAFKLRRMRPLVENGPGAHAKDRALEMARAEILLRNVVDEDPDDEWSFHYNQHHIGKAWNQDCTNLEECKRSLAQTQIRDRRNWKQLWRHFDKHMQGWWD